jgi:hypothetical protein
MAARYTLNSNYTRTPLNRKYLETYNPILTRETLSEETRTVFIDNKYDRRPDLMANDYLGSSALWWVLIHYNMDKFKDPIFDFVAGTEIVIPKKFRASGST